MHKCDGSHTISVIAVNLKPSEKAYYSTVFCLLAAYEKFVLEIREFVLGDDWGIGYSGRHCLEW